MGDRLVGTTRHEQVLARLSQMRSPVQSAGASEEWGQSLQFLGTVDCCVTGERVPVYFCPNFSSYRTVDS